MSDNPRPPEPGRPALQPTDITTPLAVTLGLLMGFATVVFLFLIGEQTISLILGSVLGIVVFGLLHYVLWGRAMMLSTAKERAELLAQDQAEMMTKRPWDRSYDD